MDDVCGWAIIQHCRSRTYSLSPVACLNVMFANGCLSVRLVCLELLPTPLTPIPPLIVPCLFKLPTIPWTAHPLRIQPRVDAKIDIPDPAPWRVLQSHANMQDYGWRQSQYHGITTGVASTRTFHRILLNPGLTFGHYF